MVDQPLALVLVDLAAADRQPHRADRQRRIRVLADGMAHRPPGAAVDDRDQVQRALVGGQLGGVGMPQPVRPGWAELPMAQVRRRRGLRVAPGQPRPPPPAPMATHQPSRAHQPGHPLAADLHPAGDLQLGMDSRGAVGATTLGVDLADLPQQGLIGASAGGGAGPRRQSSWLEQETPSTRQHRRAPNWPLAWQVNRYRVTWSSPWRTAPRPA
jgi:hypothetical protein